MRTGHRAAVLWLLCGLAVPGLVLAPAWAAAPKKPAAGRAAAASSAASSPDPKRQRELASQLQAVETQLQSQDPEQLHAGLEALRQLGPDAAPIVGAAEKRLLGGLSVELAQEAFQALSAVGQESSSAAIRPYVSHRSIALRRAAALALLRTKGQVAVQTLREALGDSDPVVRGTAATGLGNLKATQYVPDLFEALDRKVPEAAAAIGQLCSPEQCAKFITQTKQISSEERLPGFEQILFRAPSEMPDAVKLSAVSRLRELNTNEVRRFLQDVAGRWPAKWSPAVKQALDQAVAAAPVSEGAQ